MKISLITVGKVKEKYLRDAIAEYSKRLSRYCKLDIVEVADEKTPEHASEGVERQIKAKEGERIAKHIRDDAFVIALAIEGQQLTSEELARKIDGLGLHGTSHIQLIIGGSLGLDPMIVKRADYLLSFSKMTFPHQLMRVILLNRSIVRTKSMPESPTINDSFTFSNDSRMFSAHEIRDCVKNAGSR